jgi:hypothetical protein
MSQPNVAIGSASVLQELYQKKHLKLRMVCLTLLSSFKHQEALTHSLTKKKKKYPPMFDKYLKAKGILFTNNLDLWKVNRAAALQGMMKASHLKKVPDQTNNPQNEMKTEKKKKRLLLGPSSRRRTSSMFGRRRLPLMIWLSRTLILTSISRNSRST